MTWASIIKRFTAIINSAAW